MRPNRTSVTLLSTMLFAGALAACGVDDAPKEYNSLVPWMWHSYATASDEELAKGIIALAGASSEVTADSPVKAQIGHLSAADIADLGLSARDVTRARGMFVVTEFNCKLAQLEKIATSLKQQTVYPDAYDSYARTYTSSVDDYFARKTNTLSWATDLKSTQLGTTFSEHLNGGARYLPDLGKEQSPFGAALLQRTYLAKAATSSDSDKSWDQDYQIDVFVERKPGKILHLFAAWRHINFGWIDTDSDTMVKQMLSAFVDWDTQTEAACKKGLP